MMNFKSYNELKDLMLEYELDIKDLTGEDIENCLNEKIGSGWMKVISGTMLVKVQGYATRVKAEKDIEKKINLLTDLIRASAYLSNLSVATAAQDQSIARKMRR